VRFVDQGSDIPDELIRAVTAGSATFLCGAGFSFRAKLPSFKKLTEQVYARLGESPDGEPAERNAIASKEYDRALRSLEKRTHRPGTPSRVRDAVAALLAARAAAFPDHLALLQLSRDSDGRPRLLTTNFDTLFERAASAGGMASVRSYAGVSMPRAGGDRDHGIMHMHGRIADDKLNLERTDLILTSADFGDAYLRSGWASRYIEDRMRLGTLVLVGYGAEDAAEEDALPRPGQEHRQTAHPVRPCQRGDRQANPARAGPDLTKADCSRRPIYQGVLVCDPHYFLSDILR
jgi:SIR2-like domain